MKLTDVVVVSNSTDVEWLVSCEEVVGGEKW